MTSSSPDRPLTARGFLFDPATGAGAVQRVGGAVHDRGVARSALHPLRHLSAAVLESVDREIGEVAEGMLDIDLGDALVYGWRKHSDLAEAARRTLAAPGSEEVVLLAAHRIDSTYRPHVDLFVDQRLVNSFEFETAARVRRDRARGGGAGGRADGAARRRLPGDRDADPGGRAARPAAAPRRPQLMVRLSPPVPLAGKQTAPPPIPPAATGSAPGTAVA